MRTPHSAITAGPEEMETDMKTLLLATATIASIGTAFAETGENFDWAQPRSVSEAVTAAPNSQPVIAPDSGRSTLINHAVSGDAGNGSND
jgi:hypothetical protein